MHAHNQAHAAVRSPDAIAKAGVIGLSKTIAKEWGENIRFDRRRDLF